MGSISAGGIHHSEVIADGLGVVEQVIVLEEELAVADDRHERVIEVVNHPAGHFSKSAKPFLLNDLLLATFQFEQGALEFLRPFFDGGFEVAGLGFDLEMLEASAEEIANAHLNFCGVERLEHDIGGPGHESLALLLRTFRTREHENGQAIVGRLLASE